MGAVLATAVIGAQAQSAKPAPASPSPTVELADVVVTSQHRSESIQEIPVTVTAIEGSAIKEQEFRTLNEIGRTVPNFHISTIDNGGTGAPRFFLRGLGTNNNRGIRLTPFGVYVDGVYLNAPLGQNLPLFDVERIEVLRGPQGTLYGKNTIAGALNLISKAPSFDTGGYVKFGYGSYNEKSTELAFGGALSETLAARVSVYDNRRDSFVENALPGGPKISGPKDSAVRAQLLFVPNASTDWLFKVHGREISNDSSGWIRRGTLAGGRDAYGYLYPDDVRKTTLVSVADGTTTTWGTSLTGNVQLGGGIQLTSITSYESLKDTSRGTANNIVRDYRTAESDLDTTQYSQEFRIKSPQSGPLTWIAGAHFFHESLNSVSASGVNVPGGVQPARFANTAIDQGTDSAALFGSATYAVTPALDVTAGVRLTYEKKDIDLLSIGSPANTVLPGATWAGAGRELYAANITARQNEKRSWTEPTFDLNAEYKLAPNARTYGRVSRGFQSGGFNTSSNIDSPPATLKPEYLTNYEIGLKSEWFDKRLIANLAAFHYDYRDAQIFTSPLNVAGGSTASYMLNAEKSKVDGLEIELRGQATSNLFLFGNVGVLRTKYTEFSARPDAVGNQFSRAPKLTVNLGADYRFAAFGGTVALGGDLTYQSKVYFGPIVQIDPNLAQSGFTVANARVSYRPSTNKYVVSLYAKNLFDKEYRSIAINAGGSAYGFGYGAPRQVGVSVTANF